MKADIPTSWEEISKMGHGQMRSKPGQLVTAIEGLPTRLQRKPLAQAGERSCCALPGKVFITKAGAAFDAASHRLLKAWSLFLCLISLWCRQLRSDLIQAALELL